MVVWLKYGITQYGGYYFTLKREIMEPLLPIIKQKIPGQRLGNTFCPGILEKN